VSFPKLLSRQHQRAHPHPQPARNGGQLVPPWRLLAVLIPAKRGSADPAPRAERPQREPAPRPSRPRNKPIDPADAAFARILWESGRATADVARALGCPRRTVARLATVQGWTRAAPQPDDHIAQQANGLQASPAESTEQGQRVAPGGPLTGSRDNMSGAMSGGLADDPAAIRELARRQGLAEGRAAAARAVERIEGEHKALTATLRREIGLLAAGDLGEGRGGRARAAADLAAALDRVVNLERRVNGIDAGLVNRAACVIIVPAKVPADQWQALADAQAVDVTGRPLAPLALSSGPPRPAPPADAPDDTQGEGVPAGGDVLRFKASG
jgi:hypothetical protein